MVRPARQWKLRRPRNWSGPPLSAAERRVSPDADWASCAIAVVHQALEDLDAGYGAARDGSSSNARYWRAQAYLWFFHGAPTGFERFMARLGAPSPGRLPPHPLLDDAEALAGRRADLAALGLPLDLFDARIAALNAVGKRAA